MLLGADVKLNVSFSYFTAIDCLTSIAYYVLHGLRVY